MINTVSLFRGCGWDRQQKMSCTRSEEKITHIPSACYEPKPMLGYVIQWPVRYLLSYFTNEEAEIREVKPLAQGH